MQSSGGLRRDGWYGAGIGNKKLLRDGVPAQALVRKIQSMSEVAQYDITLQVQPTDGSPGYEVQGLFNVADDLFRAAQPGVTVPVRVHPSKPNRVAIDWDAWRVARRSGAE